MGLRARLGDAKSSLGDRQADAALARSHRGDTKREPPRRPAPLDAEKAAAEAEAAAAAVAVAVGPKLKVGGAAATCGCLCRARAD